FAGSGIFSFEAVSRGAASSTAVEENRKYAAAIERLATEWHAPVTVMARDVFAALPRLSGTFDLVYADPPYEVGRYDELGEAIGAGGRLTASAPRRGGNPPAAGDPREYGEVPITFFTR